MKRITTPSVATGIAVTSLFVALGGPAQAASLISGSGIKNSSVSGIDIRNNGLTGLDIKDIRSGDVRDGALTNVRLHMGDALDVLNRLPDASLERVYLLHPDPWPKARHAKRRFMNTGPIKLVARKLKPGGEFRFGTDHPVYVAHAMMVMQQQAENFDWQVATAQDFLVRPPDWPETRYERKARRLGHEVWYFRYLRSGGWQARIAAKMTAFVPGGVL